MAPFIAYRRTVFSKGRGVLHSVGLGFKRQVIQPGLGINVPLLSRPFLHSALDMNNVSWISGQCLTRILKNVRHLPALLVPVISNSHLLNKAVL